MAHVEKEGSRTVTVIIIMVAYWFGMVMVNDKQQEDP